MTTFVIIYSIFVVINIILFIGMLYTQYKRYEPITLSDIIVTFMASLSSLVATLVLAIGVLSQANVIIFQRKN